MIVVSMAGDAVIESSNNFLRFTVTLSEPPVDAITMSYRTLLNGTAIDTDLFSSSTSGSNNGTVTFGAGETTAEIFIRTTGDSIDEIDEAITLELFNLSSGAEFAGSLPVLRATGFVLDDDGPGSNLAFHVSDPVLVEGDNGTQMAVFEVRLSQPSPSSFTASFTTVDGSAVAGEDYTATSGSLSFAIGQDVAFVSVPVFGDNLAEITETFDLVVTPPGSPAIGTTGATGTATLLDDDSGMGPVVSIEGDAVVESSSNFLRFVVSLSEPPVDAITMSYRTLLNGTAIDTDLFSSSASGSNNGTVTFSAGQTSADIFIRTTGDAIDEVDEAITVELYNLSSGAEFAGGQPVLRATGIVLDNDGAGSNLAFHVSDPVLVEGDNGMQLAVFEVRLSQPAPAAFSASFTTSDGSAVAGEDYTASSGSLAFALGQEVAFVSVPVFGDSIAEVTESFDLIVTPPGSPAISANGAVGTATLLDDDSGAGPVVTVEGNAVVESSSNFLRFVITLSEAPVDSVTMNYRALLNGTAIDTDLFSSSTSSNGTVTFGAGQTSAQVFVRTTGDSIDEIDEAITLELFNLSGGASFAGGQPMLRATGIILDDDGAGSNLAFHVSDPVLVEGDDGMQLAVFEVRLSRPAPSDFTASYTTSDGSAVAGQDYTATSGSLSFAAGQDVAYVSVAVMGDDIAEITETFDLIVTPPFSPAIGSTGAVGTATLMDDDSSVGPVVSIAGDAVVESSSNFLRFVVSLSEAPVDSVTMSYRTLLDGTAVDSDLFSTAAANNGTVTFAAGQTSADIFIRTTGDAIDEVDESIVVELFNLSGGASFAGGVSTLSAVGFIQDNDGAGSNISLAAAPITLREETFDAMIYEIPVELSQPFGTALSFNVGLAGGTATPGVDFNLLETSITFEAGQVTTGIRVQILADGLVEIPESFQLSITPAIGSPLMRVFPNVEVTIQNTPLVPTPFDDSFFGSPDADIVDFLAGDDLFLAGDGNDQVQGNAGNDTIDGGDGSDIILGGAGFDILFGGNGSDMLSGGTQADEIYGGDGGDILTGGPDGSADTIYGEDGSDQIGGGDGDDRLFGGNQADVISGGAGNDLVDGGNGSDTLAGGSGNDNVAGWVGNDVLIGGTGNDTLSGGVGDDRLNGNGDRDQLMGAEGNDTLAGGLGLDALFGGTGNDSLRGNDGDDWFTGDEGNDTVFGDTGNDYLLGGSGNDRLIGGVGNDTLQGGAGADVLNAGGGNDRLMGGSEADQFVFVGSFGENLIVDFEEDLDTIVLGGFTAADVTAATPGDDVVLLINGGSLIRITDGVTDGFDLAQDVLFV